VAVAENEGARSCPRLRARWSGWWRRVVPAGSPLPREDWESRHRIVTVILWTHVPVLVAFGTVAGRGVVHSAAETSVVAAAALVASFRSAGRRLRSCAATAGLVVCSALLVHFSGGMTEMHFHFFVVMAIVTLYQDWLVFGLALLFVVLHHGILGTLDPRAVYDDPRAVAQPWVFAGIHGGFVLSAAIVNVVAWRFHEDLSLRDPLTKLANRRLFGELLERALARRDREGGTVTVLLLDLDRFKDVNDAEGHPAGDRLLVEVASRLAGAIGSRGVLARLGGDEFAVLLDPAAAPAGPLPVDEADTAARLVALAERPFGPATHEIRTGVSVGLVTVTGPLGADEVIRRADLALYEAKASGRGRVVRFEDWMAARVAEEHQLAADLRAALRAGSVGVHYQACVDLDSGAVHGFEALARWTHPTRGPVPPDVFIGVAERTGLIVELGAVVLGRACAQLVEWRATHPSLVMHVNIAPRQLLEPNLPGIVAGVLALTGLDAGALTLELTESSLMQDLDAAATRLELLKALGVRIAIDDFGKGHSALSYLQGLPVDTLKIDKAFVDPLPTERGAEVAAIIVNLGQLLHLDTIAEGVESPAQAMALVALGCRYGQGFLFSRPLPPEDVPDLLRRAAGSRSWWSPEAEPPTAAAGAPARTVPPPPSPLAHLVRRS